MTHATITSDSTSTSVAASCYLCGIRVVEAEAACSDCITGLAGELRHRDRERHGARAFVDVFRSARPLGATGDVALATL